MSEPSRQDKLQRLQKEQRSGERRRGALIWGGAVVAALAVAGAGAFVVVNEQKSKPSLAAVKSYAEQAGQHVTTPVSYPQTPPVGGEHNPVWLNCGVYNQPVPNENAVHALEHGAVWVTYREGTSAADVAKLRAALPDTYTLLSPIKTQPAPVVITAWGKQLALTGADDKRLPEFIKTYRLGPQTPEPGAACTGGMDAPGKQA
ncbi:DUF3105 domain-containing protein [Flexivirga meconopsidis]|uniref:DUF3105 domain-containing protein n=1 Tax=Flexivirga meconopsidis TaxID=2977121 RepID=UPI0022403BA7